MKLEQIFNYFNTPSDQGLVISSYCLDGEALSFCQSTRESICSWEAFLKDVIFAFEVIDHKSYDPIEIDGILQWILLVQYKKEE